MGNALTIDKIEWSKLKPYGHTTYRSFEELCYCIARNLYGHQGQFTSLDDSGGGDGVEFYLTRSNGDQWGWQAKFYFPQPRLKESNRKASIANSLRVACENHPTLTQWFLCTPTNFTTEEQRWFDQNLPSSVSPDRQVQIIHWSESDFLDWLGAPAFTGIRNYFFGDLELSLDWFRTRVEAQIADADRKYLPQLYTETNIDAVIHSLLGDSNFLQYLAQQLSKLEQSIESYRQALKDVERYFTSKAVQQEQQSYTEALTSARNLTRSFERILMDLHHAYQLLDERSIDQVQQFSWQLHRTNMEEALAVFEAGQAPIFELLESESYVKNEAQEQSGRKDFLQRLYRLSWTAYDARDIFYEILDSCSNIQQMDFHIMGAAGIGKTHLMCHICDERLRDGAPALLIAGRTFSNERPLREQLLSLFDIPSTYSWDDFLHALATAASVYRTRIPLIIDSLHEATSNGLLSSIWERELAGFIQEMVGTPGLVLITTCRTSYVKAIWSGKPPTHMSVLEGFLPAVVEGAIEKYFSWYHIKADLTASSLAQFQHPLYLKIFCESKNPARSVENQVYVGEQTLFEVFDDYLGVCNQSVCKQLGLHPRAAVVLPALEGVARTLWQHHSRSISLEEFVLVVDQKPLEALDWQHSKSRCLFSEGLLLCRDWIGGEEMVSFTYDLLGGYLIARVLLQQTSDEIAKFLRSEPTRASLFCKDYRMLHPLHEDIRRCIAALLPLRANQYLHEILPHNRIAFSTSVAAFFEMKPEAVNESSMHLVKRLFRYAQNRKRLLEMAMSTVGHVGHPLNMHFWADLLERLSLPERDLSWTESVREHAGELEKRITRFETTWQAQAVFSSTAEERLHLEAAYIMWMLSSTIYRLRNLATRALYWYGRRRPAQFFEIVLQALASNDPFISERMLAATYGVAMARQYDFADTSFAAQLLPFFGRELYEAIFRPAAPHATTHLLARDYARRTIAIASLHHPALLTEEEALRITPPFTEGGIRAWGESADKNERPYRDGNHPFGLRIGDDNPMRWLGPSIDPYHQTEESEQATANLWWRIYQLGYTFKQFQEVDRHITLSRQINHLNSGGTDHYGKKYCQIALYELAGYRDDAGLLKHEYDEPFERSPHVDIDPSFPAPVQAYPLVQSDFLGDRAIPVEEWILRGEEPEMQPYQVVDELCGEYGPWALLDGYISQQDKLASRELFLFSRSFMVKGEEAEPLVERLRSQDLSQGWLRDIPADYYIYAGEVPWCDTYPYNGETELEFVVDTTTIEEPEEKLVLFRDGEPLSKEETEDFWKSLSGQVVVHPGVIFTGGSDIDSKTIIDTVLQERGLEMKQCQVLVKREVPTYQTFRVLIPVRRNSWEGDHDAMGMEDHRGNTPAKEIATHLGLCGQPQTLDFFETDGRRASITFCHGDAFHNTQHFTYLRKDLLDRYLWETRTELIWVIWGQREYAHSGYLSREQFAAGYVDRKGFQKTFCYAPPPLTMER